HGCAHRALVALQARRLAGAPMPELPAHALEAGALQRLAQARQWLTGWVLQGRAGMSPAFLDQGEALATELRQADLQQRLMGSLARHGVPPHLLELEVTESAAMTDPQQARELLGSLLAAGVCVVLDDFGTGYSSLTYLRKLPVQSLKIDQSFVGQLPASESDKAIVTAVLRIAQGFGVKVVAEGVEEQAQAQLLHELGCEHAQGYRVERPVPLAPVLD
ncbi:EAL domain-containing protein, partial [Acinetobacter baumannii]|nr:EAL domain-containing protein [Acinetobacter baumannii]MCW1766138.1 EAL domain-containing protein [Acinetobacter baumannii]